MWLFSNHNSSNCLNTDACKSADEELRHRIVCTWVVLSNTARCCKTRQERIWTLSNLETWQHPSIHNSGIPFAACSDFGKSRG